jgi:Ca-activated chloride channel homolog
MTFEHPWLLFLLALAVPCYLLWIRARRKQAERMKRFTESAFAGKILIGLNPKMRLWHFLFFFGAIFILLAAVNGPQIAGGKELVKTSGIDMVVVLDVSNSMRAEDLQPSRLERSRLALQQLIKSMGTDRIGMVVFAGQAYTVLPLTDDHTAAEMVLESTSHNMIEVQGTAIGAGIDMAVATLVNSREDGRGQAIVVISDGENHEDDATAAASKAAEKGILVCTIGIGSAGGEKIPEVDENGNRVGYKMDENGREVVTKLDESLMKEIATSGQGIYVHASAADLGLGSVYNKLQGLSKSSKETWRYSSYTPLFPWMILLAFILLIIEPMLPEGNSTKQKTEKK